jgi:hypothetical protein
MLERLSGTRTIFRCLSFTRNHPGLDEGCLVRFCYNNNVLFAKSRTRASIRRRRRERSLWRSVALVLSCRLCCCGTNQVCCGVAWGRPRRRKPEESISTRASSVGLSIDSQVGKGPYPLSRRTSQHLSYEHLRASSIGIGIVCYGYVIIVKPRPWPPCCRFPRTRILRPCRRSVCSCAIDSLPCPPTRQSRSNPPFRTTSHILRSTLLAR